MLTPGQAVVWAAAFNFLAAFGFGTAVAKTVGAGMVDLSVVTSAVIFSGLLGAIVWDLITWYIGLPTSSSHALVGGYAGAAIAKAGWQRSSLSGWTKTLIFIVLAPMMGMALGLLISIITLWMFRDSLAHRVDKWFRRLQLVSAALYSLGHGTNDAQKTMGIIAGVLLTAGYLDDVHDSVLGDPVGACRHRPRHAVGRLAHRPHDGQQDHQAAAVRRLRRRNRRRHHAVHRQRHSACRSAPPTRSPAPSSASDRCRRVSAVRWGVATTDRLGLGADDSRRRR